MRLLLDTHVVLWFVLDEERSRSGRFRVLDDPTATVLLSAVVWWEVAIKSGLGKLKVPDDIELRLDEFESVALSIDREHAWQVRDLPPHHGDPFDRLLVAQAKVERATLVTADRRLAAYDDVDVLLV